MVVVSPKYKCIVYYTMYVVMSHLPNLQIQLRDHLIYEIMKRSTCHIVNQTLLNFGKGINYFVNDLNKNT